MECVELAPAVGCVARFESGSKLHALHTLRAVWFRLCRPGDRRALPVVLDSPNKAVLGLAQQLEGREWKDAAQLQAGRGGCIDAEANGASRFVTGLTHQVAHGFVKGAIRVTEMAHCGAEAIFQ